MIQRRQRFVFQVAAAQREDRLIQRVNMHMLWFTVFLGLFLYSPLFQTHYQTLPTIPQNKLSPWHNLKKQIFFPDRIKTPSFI